MKKNLYISILSLLLVAVAGCQQDEFAPAADNSREITLTIPQYPQGVGAGLVSAQHPQGQSLSGQTQGLPLHPAADTRAIPPAKTQWEEGDVLYIYLECANGNIHLSSSLYIARRTASGTWQYNKPLAVPVNATDVYIETTYTDGQPAGEVLTGDILYSLTSEPLPVESNPDIVLNILNHYYSRITFTNLQEGDVIEFKGQNLAQFALDNSTYQLGVNASTAPITADADGQAVVYTRIMGRDECHFRILSGGTANPTAPWYNLDPGPPNPDGSSYCNYTYTVNVEDMIAKGDNTPEEMEEKERFLVWARSGRWKTEDFTLTHDIDLTGEDWTPIAPDNSHFFEKTFDGGGHTIRGLKVDKPDDSFIGLFGYITGTVKNLTVEGSVTGKDCVGGIAGMNNGIISGCTFRGTITGTDTNIGGIAGTTPSGGITGCWVTGSTITGAGFVGGITGDLGGSSTGVIACLVTNTEIGGTPAGGFPYYGGIAGGSNSRLVACASSAITVLVDGCLGGIVALNNSSGTLTACYRKRDISTDTFTLAIGQERNTSDPQESNCTGFSAFSGGFKAEYVVAVNQAIEDSGVPCDWRFKESAISGGMPLLYVP